MKLKIKEALAELKSNQSELANDCNISKQSISLIILGKSNPTELTKMKLEIALNEYRNSEIKQLQRRIQYLCEMEWII